MSIILFFAVIFFKQWKKVKKGDISWILARSLLGFMAFYLIYVSLIYIPIGTLILQLDIVFAILLGYFFYKEVLNQSTIIGGILIALAVILPYARIKKIKLSLL